MLLLRGEAEDTALTGTLYEPGETPPSYRGAPDEGSPYTWVCDEFYEVARGGQVQWVGDREVRVAFADPLAGGFERREAALAAAREHLRTQFARLGVDPAAVEVSVVDAEA